MPEVSDENKTVDGTKDDITSNVSIECHAESRKQATELAEEIRNILKVTGKNDLIKAALFGPDVTGTSMDSDFIGTKKYYTFTTDYMFKRFD